MAPSALLDSSVQASFRSSIIQVYYEKYNLQWAKITIARKNVAIPKNLITIGCYFCIRQNFRTTDNYTHKITQLLLEVDYNCPQKLTRLSLTVSK